MPKKKKKVVSAIVIIKCVRCFGGSGEKEFNLEHQNENIYIPTAHKNKNTTKQN